ncbi:glutamine amidotransferase [Desulfoscipio gibsoniae]|uniref:Glutamate synthase family protein n=1 Tax=Desulfoscipio gibsoniae DSM 7213 TaxID=767817 RepID=R4KNZ9_9FIRM|nr:glutamine amidotransferase [Desulfoscipio gibsoniae]AGL02290.1 glutamate synthase family protein [Desulfoscipio gibsoniae DSM 7213]
MCGIAGIINKNGMDISAKLLEMLCLIQHRGPDASGIAVYGEGPEVSLRVSITQKEMVPTLENIIVRYGTVLSSQFSDESRAVVFADLKLVIDRDHLAGLHAAINSRDGLYVHSLGRGMKVYKDGGTITNLTKHHIIENCHGTHGLGHVRMATESAEDINAAHPFVSPFYPELTIVHNGQFTNYFNMRRYLESKGAIFKTLNDSEAASHLIALAMRQNGGDLKDALHFALEEMDGIFCIIAATSNQIGIARDKLGIKPLLLFEKEGITLIGSEQIEFTAVFPDVYADEIEPGEVMVWNI